MRVGGVVTLKKRSDFLRLAKFGTLLRAKSLCVQVAKTIEDVSSDRVRVGFTASKKVGNAVRRNKVKRRLRAIVRAVLFTRGMPEFEYVLIANRFSYDAPFRKLKSDAIFCLREFLQKS